MKFLKSRVGLNKLLWKSQERERGVEMDENGDAVTYSWERAGVGSGAVFFFFFFFTLIENRDVLQWKKYDEKHSSHELKARGRGL